MKPSSIRLLKYLPVYIAVHLVLFSGESGSAAGVEEVYSFLKRPKNIYSLVQGDDGYLYGTADGGKRIDKSDWPDCGFVFRVGPDGSATVLHRFDGTDGIAPKGLVRGPNGWFYGVTDSHGYGRAPVATCVLFRINTQGTFETLHAFPDGVAPAEILVTADGTVYGTTQDAGTGYDTARFSGAIYRRLPNGEFSDFAWVANGLENLFCDSAGNLYGVNYTAFRPNGTSNSPERLLSISSGGTVRELMTFPDKDFMGFAGFGSDGCIYGLGHRQGTLDTDSRNWIFRITADGSYSELYTSRRSFQWIRQDATGVYFLGPILAEPTSTKLAILRLNPDGSVSEVAALSPTDVYADGKFTDAHLVVAADGNMFAARNAVSSYYADMTTAIIHRIDPGGAITDFASYLTGEGEEPSGGLVAGTKGSLFGVTYAGGQNDRGTVFRFDHATGRVTQVHAVTGAEGRGPIGRLAVDSAGTMHGMLIPEGNESQSLFSCTASGAFAVRHTFPPRNLGEWGFSGRLAFGGDGALCGFWEKGRDRHIFRIDGNDVFSEIAVFRDTTGFGEPILGPNGWVDFPQGPSFGVTAVTSSTKGKIIKFPQSAGWLNDQRPAIGSDGALYGIGYGPWDHQGLFRIDLMKPALTPVRELPAHCSGLVRGSDGLFYGTFIDYLPSGNNLMAFAASVDGGFRALGEVRHVSPTDGSLDTVNVQALAEGPDGNLYGTYPTGGEWGGGSIFRVAPTSGNTPPIARPDSIMFAGKLPAKLDVLSNDSDTDGDFPLVTAVTSGSNGSVTIDRGGGVTYAPGKTFNGTDSFTYTISDGFGGNSTAAATVTNPFYQSGGTYKVLLSDSNGVPYALWYWVLDPVTGAISGKASALSGQGFSIVGNQRVISRLDLATQSLWQKNLEVKLLAPGVLSTIVGGGAANVYSGTVSRDATGLPAQVAAGKYTLLLPPPAGANTLPGGYGFAVGSVSSKGLAKFAGVLPDGMKFTFGGQLAADGKLNLLIPLYSKPKGYLAGVLDFTACAGSHALGALRWVKPAQKSPGTQIYPDGFAVSLNAEGAVYVPPAKGISSLHGHATSANYNFIAAYHGQPALLQKALAVDGADKGNVLLPGVEALKVTFTPATGLLSAGFVSAADGVVRLKCTGTIYQPESAAYGLFSGAAATGGVEIEPATP